jgi:MFS family permease
MGTSAPATADQDLAPAERLAIERWFVRRGVPQLVEGYGSEARLDARAAPGIAAWLVIGTALFWGVNPAWPAILNVAAATGTVLFVALAFLAIRWLRRRPPIWRLMTFDVIEIGLLGLLSAVPAGLIDGSLREFVIAFLNCLLGIGLIYVAVLFGLIEVAWWALGRLRTQVAGIVGLIATTLPILLILVAFLLFAAEIWEAAHALHGGELAALIGLLILIASLLVVTTFRAELARLDEEPTDWEAVVREVEGTPVQAIALGMPPPQARTPPLGRLERINLTALVLINQLLQSAFVALLMMAFLVAFGIIALPAEVQERWIGEPITSLGRFDLFAEERRLSAELLSVSAMLSAIVGLYFTGLAITDSANRGDQFRRAVAEVRQLLSVRAVYLAALGADGGRAAPAARPQP